MTKHQAVALPPIYFGVAGGVSFAGLVYYFSGITRQSAFVGRAYGADGVGVQLPWQFWIGGLFILIILAGITVLRARDARD